MLQVHSGSLLIFCGSAGQIAGFEALGALEFDKGNMVPLL